MLYRTFGKTQEKVSILGFGCMRLPQLPGGDASQIDEEKALPLIRSAIDQGLNYIDTAYPYHGNSMGSGGASEPFIGKVLQDGYREKVLLASKLPCWLIKSRADFDRYLDEQLARLQTDHLDFYLMHALDEVYWAILKQFDFADFLDKAMASGKIRYAGFSFHAPLALFKEIVDAYDWSFCQIQYNYLDENFQAGTEGLKYAAAKGLGITIMEPLRGGKLAQNLPDDVKAVLDRSPIKRTPAEWALRWVWNHPEVSVVLSGMNATSQLLENLQTAATAQPESLKPDQLALIDEAKAIFQAKIKVNCTGCSYCQPCPHGVNIPKCFSIYNNYYLFGENRYDSLSTTENAANCVSCGLCETHCPQDIAIRQELAQLDRILAAK